MTCSVLVVIHPRGITDATQFAIDQFVLRGGRLLAFLDPKAVLDRSGEGMGAMGSASGLDKLLKAWGISFDTSKVVADMNYVARTRQGRAPAILALTEKAMNKDDIVTADADNVVMALAGTFSGTPAPGLKETVLIKSSKDSELVDGMMAQFGGESIATQFQALGEGVPACRALDGKVQNRFPRGQAERANRNRTRKRMRRRKSPLPALKESTTDTRPSFWWGTPI